MLIITFDASVRTLVILDFSTAVPVTNALTLLVTYLCDVIARPQLLNSSRAVLGDRKSVV